MLCKKKLLNVQKTHTLPSLPVLHKIPIDHDGILVSAAMHKQVVDWYPAALKPLGHEKVVEMEAGGTAAEFGINRSRNASLSSRRTGRPLVLIAIRP